MNFVKMVLSIDSFFVKKKRMYEKVTSEINALKKECKSKEELMHNKYQAEIQSVLSEKEDILKFYKIAKENTSRELIVAGNKPVEPDVNRLATMIYKIDENNPHDPTAAEVVEMMSGHIVYYDSLIERIQHNESHAVQTLRNTYTNTISGLHQKRTSILDECAQYLAGDEVKQLRTLLDNQANGIPHNNDGNPLHCIPFGYQRMPISIPSILDNKAQEALGMHYEKGYIWVPCIATSSTQTHVVAEYLPCSESTINNAVRAFVIAYLRRASADNTRITILDSINFSSSILGDMAHFAGLPDGVVEAVPPNDHAIRQKVEALSEYYQKIDRKLGNKTVADYNAKAEKGNAIPFRLLIVNREAVDVLSHQTAFNYLFNNADRFGIHIFEFVRNRNGGSKNTEKEKAILKNASSHIIISDQAGHFFKGHGMETYLFKWAQAPEQLSSSALATLETASKRQRRGPNYYSYFTLKKPERSKDKRKPIIVPFARDINDNVVSCSFENENFAAYMMGASRSGKSTLLHTMICSIITNYHPDEVELWLVDFKRTEFRQYASYSPPHLKYLLLEESEELIFDLIDELTEVLNHRMKVFAANDWSKQTEVPLDVYMPVIFVIIDEFAQVSQKLRKSQFSGGTNYTRALENLLAKGAAFGMKFLFASQSYNTGVEGLSTTARKQIQMRFALKNTSDEIKETLNINAFQSTEDVMDLISSLQVYETLFKCIDEQTGAPVINKYYNLKVEKNELASSISFVKENIIPSDNYGGASTYKEKHPVLLIDDKPLTFKSMVPSYLAFEKRMHTYSPYQDIDSDDILLYLGTPCSFKLVKPIPLKKRSSENLLIIGNNRDSQASLLLSIINSWRKNDTDLDNLEIWAHEQYPTFKKYSNLLERVSCYHDFEMIHERLDEYLSDYKGGCSKDKLIICLGLDALIEDFNDYSHLADMTKQEVKHVNADDLWSLMTNPCVSAEDIQEYNNDLSSLNNGKRYEPNAFLKSLDFLISKGPRKGIHFVFCFMQYRDYLASNLKSSDCEHVALFPMPQSESYAIAKVDTSNLNEGEFLYSNGLIHHIMRPHIYNNIPCNGWIIENDEIVRI